MEHKHAQFLKSQDCWEVVESEFIKLDLSSLQAMKTNQGNAIVKNMKKGSRALWILQNGVEETIFPRIKAEIKAHQAWEIPETTYQDTYKVKICQTTKI